MTISLTITQRMKMIRIHIEIRYGIVWQCEHRIPLSHACLQCRWLRACVGMSFKPVFTNTLTKSTKSPLCFDGRIRWMKSNFLPLMIVLILDGRYTSIIASIRLLLRQTQRVIQLVFYPKNSLTHLAFFRAHLTLKKIPHLSIIQVEDFLLYGRYPLMFQKTRHCNPAYEKYLLREITCISN